MVKSDKKSKEGKKSTGKIQWTKPTLHKCAVNFIEYPTASASNCNHGGSPSQSSYY